MPRKGPATRREIVGDPIYKSVLVTQFVNKILQRGKRSTAERIMYDALGLVPPLPPLDEGHEPLVALDGVLDRDLELRADDGSGRAKGARAGKEEGATHLVLAVLGPLQPDLHRLLHDGVGLRGARETRGREGSRRAVGDASLRAPPS